MSPPGLVLDANAVLVALLTASGMLVEGVGAGTVQLVVSAPVVAEYWRTVEEHGAVFTGWTAASTRARLR